MAATDVTSWVQSTMGESDCVSAEKVRFEQNGGRCGELFLLNTKYEDGSTATRILKTFVGEAQLDKSKLLGWSREGILLARYNKDSSTHTGAIHDTLSKMIPKIYYSEGNPTTGDKLIVMEKVNGYETGMLFPDSRSTWETPKDHLEKIRREYYNQKQLTSEPVDFAVVKEVCEDAFRKAARLHAVSWMNEELLQSEYWSVLRNVGWMSSDDVSAEPHPEWKKAMEWATSSWEKLPSMKSPPKLTPFLKECIDSSLSKINFLEYKKMFKGTEATIPWCLAHGDFYPGNVLLDEKTGKTLLVDFEMAGVGSGPQDLGQYMISHCPPEMRRSLEKHLVTDVYYNELAAKLKEFGKPVPDLSLVWDEYKAGGAGKWIWFICVLIPLEGASRLLQFFCDQTAAFLEDHFNDPNQIGQPRV